MNSLSRILNLAHRTGGPVVIFDSHTDTDFVLMRGEDYEEMEYSVEDDLLDDWFDIERRTLIEDMDSEDLLDQINRDIAVWRAKEQQERREVVADKLERELIETPLSDPFAEDFAHSPEWHTPADILRDMTIPDVSDASLHDMYGKGSFVGPKDLRGLRTDMVDSELDWEEEVSEDDGWSQPYPLESVQRVELPIHLEEVPFDPPLIDEETEAEPLPDDDAPVFYDEPIV